MACARISRLLFVAAAMILDACVVDRFDSTATDSELALYRNDELAYVLAATPEPHGFTLQAGYALDRVDGRMLSNLEKGHSFTALVPGTHALEFVQSRNAAADSHVAVELNARAGQTYVPHLGHNNSLFVTEQPLVWVTTEQPPIWGLRSPSIEQHETVVAQGRRVERGDAGAPAGDRR